METRWESITERGIMNKLHIYSYLNVENDATKTKNMWESAGLFALVRLETKPHHDKLYHECTLQKCVCVCVLLHILYQNSSLYCTYHHCKFITFDCDFN